VPARRRNESSVNSRCAFDRDDDRSMGSVDDDDDDDA
jgi:hypothetical protein